MGGSGSGNWYRWSKRTSTDQYRCLDVRKLHREGSLRPGSSSIISWSNADGKRTASMGVKGGNDAVTLHYTVTIGEKEPEDLDYRVPLSWTPCNYGAKRPCFLCPGQDCGRRVALLYQPGRYYLCRHCYDLVYTSQQENPAFRLLSKAQNIRRSLGGSAILDDPFPPKPKGMHWRTYKKLQRECERAGERSWQIMEARFGPLPF